jgi:hypothetical protein
MRCRGGGHQAGLCGIAGEGLGLEMREATRAHIIDNVDD